MKIAVLTEIINRKSGSRAPLEIAKALKAQGNEVTVFAFRHHLEKGALKELKEWKIEISFIEASRIVVPFILARRLRNKFDIISYHAKVLFFIGAWLSKLPMIRTYHGTQLNPILDKQFPDKPTILTKILNWMANTYLIFAESLLLHNSDKILAISKYAQGEVKRLYKFPAEYIYYGAVPSHFKYRRKKHKKETIIISVSRVIPYKGFHRLIKIFNRLSKKNPEIKLEVLGSAPDRKYLAYLKKMAGNNINFFLNLPDGELIKHYQQADIYTTFDHYMFFGMPLLEAGFFGLPTVAIAKCAAPEIIQHGKTGFLAKNEAEFTSYLEKLIKNPRLRDKMGRQARQEIKKFSWETFGKQYVKWFNEVIETSKRKALSRKEKKQSFIFLGAILILGTLLRLAFLSKHTFWFDEAFSYFVATQPISSLLQIAVAGNNPPFYYLILKLWLGISREVWFFRFLSLIFGVAVIPLFYKIAKKLTNAKIALLSSFILAVSPLHLYFSTETRMYALLVFESLLLSWFFLKFLENGKKLHVIPLTVIAVLALYTHYYAAFILLALNLAFLPQIKRVKKLIFPWVISQSVTILAFLPLFLLMRQNPNPQCWCFPPLTGIPATFASFAIGGMGVVTLKDFVFHGPRLSLAVFGALSIFMFTFFLLGLWSLRKATEKREFILVFFFTPLIAATIIAFLYPLFSPRALIIIAPLYYLLVATGILSLKGKIARYLTICSLVALMLATLAFQFFIPFFSGPPLEKVASFVAEKRQRGEVILHSSPFTLYSFQYYHHYSYPEFLILPSTLVTPKIFEIGNYKKSVEEITLNNSKIWLVNTHNWVRPEEAEKIKRILSKDFLLDFERKYNNIEIYHFTRKDILETKSRVSQEIQRAAE